MEAATPNSPPPHRVVEPSVTLVFLLRLVTLRMLGCYHSGTLGRWGKPEDKDTNECEFFASTQGTVLFSSLSVKQVLGGYANRPLGLLTVVGDVRIGVQGTRRECRTKSFSDSIKVDRSIRFN